MEPIDLGNGVLQFNCTGSQFCSSLSSYLEKNKDKIVIAICGEICAGTTTSYIVVVG
jgi:hypothetical protein